MQVSDTEMGLILADDDFNCRGTIAKMDVVDLAKNIQLNGLIQPVVVVPLTGQRLIDNPDKQFLLIAGYRRFNAFIVNGETRIPAVHRADMGDEADARIFNLSENLERKDLNIMQEARALSKLESLGISETDAAKRLNMSRGWIQVRYMVLRLPQLVQEEIAAGWLSQKQIRDVYSHLKDSGEEACFEAVKGFKDDKIKGRTGTRKKVKKKSKKKQLETKKHRTRDEIFELQQHIYDEFGGNNICTRLLAWGAGEIPDLDVHMALQEFAKEQGRGYRFP
jgi:ParB family chromosome partitioning protein